MKALKQGKFRGIVKQANGIDKTVVLQDVKYVPELWTNLLSLTKIMQNGGKIESKENALMLVKANQEMIFDKKYKAGDGFTMGVEIEPIGEEISQVCAATNENRKRMHIEDFHRLLGHPSEAKTRDTATWMNIELFGRLDKCESCNLGKAKRKKIAKEAQNKSKIPGQRLYIDLSSIRDESSGGKKHWLLIVDEATDYKWSKFLRTKSELPKIMLEFLKERKSEGLEMKFIRLDNAGENKKFQELAKKQGFSHLIFEFTAPGTPMQNGVVERGFATLIGRVRAMMNNAGFTKEMRAKLWAECARTATMLENNMPDKKGEDPPTIKLYQRQGTWMKNLRTFGEMAIVTNSSQNKIAAKLENKGKIVMLTGYSDEHPRGSYRFVDMNTKRAIMSRDVAWLNKTWSEYQGIKKRNIIHIEDSESGYELEDESSCEKVNPDDKFCGIDTNENPETKFHGTDQNENSEENFDGTGQYYSDNQSEIEEIQDQEGSKQVKSNIDNNYPKLNRELRNLDTFYNPVLKQYEENNDAMVAFIGAVDSDPKEPMSFKEAWWNEDKQSRQKWREAIRKEFSDMIRKGVWRITKKANVPQNRRLIGSKWVFKVKRNGVFRARLVALGYNQIPGVDYTDNFAPVINDVTYRLVLLNWLINDWDSQVIDVETAFLYGNLEEEIYLKCPEGLSEVQNIEEGDCLLLKKSIYGLVQAARQWWKLFVEYLTKQVGFKKSYVDPCLLILEMVEGKVFFCIYVDDALIVGNKKVIEFVIQKIEERFSIKKMGQVKLYVGCKIIRNKEKTMFIAQPDLIDKLQKTFGNKVNNLYNYKTPGPPGESVVRPKEQNELITNNDQKEFRSGVGMLLYLVKHSRPDISNAVRELAKVMDGANLAHMKMLY